MINTHLIHIDKKIFKKSVYMLEFSFSFIGQNDEYSSIVTTFVNNYSPLILLSANLLLLYGLTNEKKLLEDIYVNKNSLHLDTYSLICVDKGYIASSWLKKI